MERAELIADLQPFADVGDSAIKVSESKDKKSVSMMRDGRKLRISLDATSRKVTCNWGAAPARTFSTFSAMLASNIFADLRRWADAQIGVIKNELPNRGDLLPIYAITHDDSKVRSVEDLDTFLSLVDRNLSSTQVLVIDGPAGIGKTSLIQQLALYRAETYKVTPCVLVLHVKSRGRVLSNIQDLMAFSLQTIRSKITYDQVPILTKHGLVALAIDGFDELADPNGYETAWAQLGELVSSVRGSGTLILAGRDTFVGRSRLIKDVPALRADVDLVQGITMGSPTPEQAKEWLRKHQWTEVSLASPAVSVLLEDDSFALRPVFLRMLVGISQKDLRDTHVRYLTPILVELMIEREAELFGSNVASVLSKDRRIEFIRSLLCEVARQMADNQAEALDASEISWISEMCLGEGVPQEVVATVRNRASVTAFFINDERQGYRTFMHSHLMNYFLSIVVIDATSKKETPKFIRRNILGSEFLAVFADVASDTATLEKQKFAKFMDRALSMPMVYSSIDRGLRNIGALVLAGLPAANGLDDQPIVVREFSIDDAVMRGSYPACKFINVTASQIDCRGADLALIEWDGGAIGSMVADDSIRVSGTWPVPAEIVLPPSRHLRAAPDVEGWLDTRGRNSASEVQSGIASAAVRSTAIYKLLKRAARVRQYWLRDDADDFAATKILNDPEWDRLSEILSKHEFLRIETRAAAGRASRFYHIRHRDRILEEASADTGLRSVLEDFV